MSGLSILKRLLMKQAMKESAPFQHEGIMSISKSLAGNVDTKIKRMVESAKRQGADLDNLSEQELKYMLEMNKPKGPTIGGHRVIDASSAEGKGITEALLGKQGQVIKGNFGKPFAEEVGSVDGTIKYLKTLEPMDAMKETNKVLKGDGRYKSLSKADREKIAMDESVTDHIFERNIPIDPEDMAGGGVAGLLGERPGYNKGLKVQGSGSISGKNQIQGAPEGITSNKSFINLIANLDIPISEKISLLGDVQYNKFRDKIERGDEELFIEDPASYINKKIGIGINQDNEGFSGSAKYDVDSGEPEFNILFKKSFAQGGPARPGYASGNGVADEDAEKAALGKRVRQLMDEEGYDFGEAVKEAMKEGYADGGPARQNFKMGKRAFLKLMGGVGAGIAGLKSGLLGLGKGATKKAVTETVKQTAGSGTPPPYFFKLVEKIKTLGDDVTSNYATKDREVVKRYKDYTLTEDVTTGEKTIQRMKIDDDLKYDASEYYGKPVGEDVYMNYKPGKSQIDETTKGKTPPDEYTEDTSLIRSDRPAEGEIMETVDGVPDDILEEVGETIVKKADGGRIGYNVGKRVGVGIINLINKKFGKGTMTTADKIKRPQQALDREMFKKFQTNYPETGAADATLNIPVQQEGKFTKAEYLIQRLENTIKQNPKDKYVKKTFPGFIKELKANPELAKNENVFKELGGDLPKGQQIVVYGDDSIDFFTQKSGPKNINRLKKIMSKYNISKDKALKIMKMEPNDQVMEFKMLEIANRKLNATGGLAAMLGE